MAKTIFDETQDDRDSELASYANLPLTKIRELKILAKESIQVFKDEDITADSYDFLYAKYNYLNPVHYIRTLSFVTLDRRASYIRAMAKVMGGLQGKTVMDYGCGVGSHGIFCLQNGAAVDFLDVDGPLYNYAKYRINRRGLAARKLLYPDAKLQPNGYDAIICLDVLEHVADPIAALRNIIGALKVAGVLCLEVSTGVKPTSGHFSKSIHAWNVGHAPVMQALRNVEPYIYRKK